MRRKAKLVWSSTLTSYNHSWADLTNPSDDDISNTDWHQETHSPTCLSWLRSTGPSQQNVFLLERSSTSQLLLLPCLLWRNLNRVSCEIIVEVGAYRWQQADCTEGCDPRQACGVGSQSPQDGTTERHSRCFNYGTINSVFFFPYLLERADCEMLNSLNAVRGFVLRPWRLGQDETIRLQKAKQCSSVNY